MEAVLVALVTALLGPLLLNMFQSRRLKRVEAVTRDTQATTNATAEKIQTNHGREPREYLEMIAEVKLTSELTLGMVDALAKQLGVHTRQDSENFEIINARLDRMTGDDPAI